jgi:hypothetical protein
MSLLDELSPRYIGEDRLTLALVPGAEPRAFRSVEVTVDYSRAAPEGASLPLELTVKGPTSAGFVRRYFRRARPSALSFVPAEGGVHLVRLREVGHNRWVGLLEVQVSGSRLRETSS